MEVVGLIPAGGKATRIAPLPCSKELYPVGFWHTGKDNGLRPKVACHYLLEKMQLAGITKTFIVLRDGKWDIPAYLGDGAIFNMHLAYLMRRLPFGVPYTLDQAYPFVRDSIVALGFPDIIFQSEYAFTQLLQRQLDTKADIVLGIFPADQPQKWDMLELDENGRIIRLVIKPARTDLCYTWAISVWTPVFTHFMHNYLLNLQEAEMDDGKNISGQRELFVGNVFQAAIESGLQTEGVFFSDNNCLDIGTPADLLRASQIMG